MLARALLLVLVSGGWTGGESTPATRTTAASASRAPTVQGGLRIEIEHIACAGDCPTYTLVVHGDGLVEWYGREHVRTKGLRTARIVESKVAELRREIEIARFFERDRRGRLPDVGPPVSCAETSQVIVTVTVDDKSHTVDQGQCEEREWEEMSVRSIEALVRMVANQEAWIDE